MPASDGVHRVGDELTASEASCISHLLRVSGLIDPNERFYHALSDSVTAFCHPVSLTVGNAFSSAMRGDFFDDNNNPLLVPPHRWRPTTMTDVRRAAEEAFVSLDATSACARILRAADMARQAAVGTTDILRASAPVSAFGTPARIANPHGPTTAESVTLAAREAMEMDPDCSIPRSSALSHFLDHVNGVAMHRTDTSAAVGGDGGSAPTKTVLRRTTEAIATECRALLFERHWVLAIPYPGWVADEAFARAYAQALSPPATGGASPGRRSSPSRHSRRGNAATVYDLGGTHQSFVDDVVEPPPQAVLPPHIHEACQLAVDAFRSAETAPWLQRRQNPFSSVSLFEWEPRRFLIRVIPLHHVISTRSLPRGWWTSRGQRMSTLQIAMLALAAQLNRDTPDAATVAALSGLVVSRGGAGGQAFSTSPERASDSSLGMGQEAVESQRRATAEAAAATEVAILWDSGAVTTDPQRSFSFLLKQLWGTLDPAVASAVERDSLRFKALLRQRTSAALANAVQLQQGAHTGFNDRGVSFARDGSGVSPSPPRSIDPITAAALDATMRSGNVILVASSEVPYVVPVVLDHPSIVVSMAPEGKPGGMTSQRTLREPDLYCVPPGIVNLAKFTDEHRVVSSLFSMRTLLNPEHDPPPIQRLAAGACRDVAMLERVEGTVCVFHYTVELVPVFIEPPTAEVAARNEPPQIATMMVEAKPRYMKAFEHAVIVQTGNVMGVCERELQPEHLHSDVNYRTNVLASIRLQAGSRMCLDHSSVLSMTLSDPVFNNPSDLSSQVVKITMVYSGKPVVNATGGPGDFDPLDPSTVLEVHRFSIAGSRAWSEALELQTRWLKYCAAIASCEPPDGDLRAVHASFVASAIGQPISLDDRKARYNIALSVATEWTEYHMEQSRFRKKQSAGKPSQAPKIPVPQLAVDIRPAFMTRRSLSASLDAVVPHHAVSGTIFGGAVLTWCRRATTLASSTVPPSKQLLPLVGWFRYTHALFAGTTRERTAVLLRGITHATPPHQVGFVHRDQLAALLLGVTSDAAAVTDELWRSLPSFRQPLAPLSEIESALDQPTSVLVTRLAGLKMMAGWTASAWRETVFLGNPLWRPALRVMITASIVSAFDAATRASGRRSPSPGPALGAATTGDVSVKPEWRQAMPWLPMQQSTIPQKTHVFLERKYLHQRVYSLDSGVVVDEVWNAKLASPPSGMGSAVVELCPDVCSNLRELSGVTAAEIGRSLGIAGVTAALVGGTFAGLRRLSTAYSNPLTNVNRPVSNVFSTADGQFLVQFLEPTALHKLLTTMPKYHAHIYAQGRKTLVPRYVGLYAAYLAPDATSSGPGSMFDGLADSSQQRDLVFFAVLMSPTRVLSRLCAEKPRYGADIVTHVAGDIAVKAAPGVWKFETSSFSSPGQPVTRFDVPEDVRAPALLALKRDASLFATDCGFSGFSCAMYFFRAETFAEMDIEFEGRVGDATQTLNNAPLLDSCVADARHWYGAHRPKLVSDQFGIPARAFGAALGTNGVTPPSEASPSRSMLASPFQRKISSVPTARRADETPLFLGNLSRFEGRPVLRWTSGAVPAATLDDTAYTIDYGSSGGGVGKAGQRSSTKMGGTITVEVAPPATWTCSGCSTINMRTRNAAMVKPCHVCFGINERFGDSVIPVVTTAAEYTKLVNRASETAPRKQVQTQQQNGTTNVFGMDVGDDVMSPPERRVFERSKGVSVHRPQDPFAEFDDDDDYGRGGTGLFGDVDDRYEMSTLAKPGPRQRGENPFNVEEADTFSRLARTRAITGAAASLRRLSKDFLEKFQSPGTLCIPAAVQGRPDVYGFLMLFMVDTLGTTESRDAETSAVTEAYLRSYQSNVMDALGDDFL